MFAYLGRGLIIGLSAGITPGPLLAYLLSKSIRLGWRKTLSGAFAPLISDGPIIILVLALLTRVPEPLLNALGFAGGLFLLTIASKTIRSTRTNGSQPGTNTAAQSGTVWTAVLINLLNPNPYIFWGTVLGPTLLLALREDPVHGIAYAGGFYLAMITVFGAWIVAAGTLGRTDPRRQQAVSYLSALGLGGYGIFQIVSVFT